MSEETFEELFYQLLDKVESMKQVLFTPDERILQEITVENRKEYEVLLEHYRKYCNFDTIINDIGLKAHEGWFVVKGYCAVCESEQMMAFVGRDGDTVRGKDGCGFHMFREDLFCLECGCNSRMRYMIQKMKKSYQPGMKVYMYEHITRAYQAASQFIPVGDLVGSEYFGDAYQSGEYVNGVLHEDATALSFADAAFDMVVSMDVFEHIYEYQKAFAEAYRVLRPGGKLLLSIPMHPALDKTLERARFVNGEIVHILEPEIHGDPLSPQGGILAFVTYGWDVLSLIKGVGFSDVKMTTFYSIDDAYLGCLQFLFEMKK